MAHIRCLCAALFGLVGAFASPTLQAADSSDAARAQPVDPAQSTKARSPRDAALIVGNEAYTALPQVTWAGDDARSFHSWFSQTRGVSKWRTRTITDGSAARILKEARRVSWRVKRGGTLWVTYAGHGTVNDAGERILLGAGAQGGDLARDSVTLKALVSTLERSRAAKRVVLVLDAGFGNVGRGGLELVPGRQVDSVDGFAAEQTDRTLIWAATRDSGRAGAFVAAKHGLFTWTALGALRGWADGELDETPDQKVTMEEAQAYGARVTLQLGQLQRPWLDDRSDVVSLILDQGSHLEEGPADASLRALGRQDLQRRVRVVEEAVQADATAFWNDTLALAQEGGPGGREALEAYIQEFSGQRATLTWGVYVPEVREARQVLLGYDDTGVPASAAAAILTVEPCDDLLSLESPAIMGQLTEGQRTCLDARATSERLQTTKSKVSRLLMVNAEASGDRAAWRRLVSRHLEDIDRSDPDLCFAYALFMHRTGDLDVEEEVIRWAGIALENKQSWQGDDFTRKVTGLLRLQSEAAHKLWSAAEKAYRAEANGENEAMTDTFRGWAKDYSREWLDYTRAAGLPFAKALKLCEAASGTSAFCAEGASR